MMTISSKYYKKMFECVQLVETDYTVSVDQEDFILNDGVLCVYILLRYRRRLIG